MKVSATYQAKLDIGSRLAALNARSITIADVTCMRPADARDIFHNTNDEKSVRGKTPSKISWLLENDTRRQHCAFFLITYARYRSVYKPISKEASGLAFTRALDIYQKVAAGNDVINPERFALLVSGFAFNWMNITGGESSTFDRDNVRVARCSCCDGHFLVSSHIRRFTCDSCAQKKQ